MKKLINVSSVFFSVFLGMSFISSKKADAGASVAILPAKIVFNTDKPGNFTEKIEVRNTGSELTKYKAEMNDFTIDSDGIATFYPDFGSVANSTAKGFVTFSPEEFTIEAGESQIVEINISVPENYETESRYSAIMVYTVPLEESDTSAVFQSARIGIPVILNLLPEGSENLSTSEIIDKKISALDYEIVEHEVTYEYDYWNKDEKNIFKKINWDKFFDPPKVKTRTVLKNTGNISFETAVENAADPQGGSYHSYEFKNTDSTKYFPLRQYTFYPGTEREWVSELDKVPTSGEITVKTKIYIESENNFIEAEDAINIFPKHWIVLAMVMLVILFLIVFSTVKTAKWLGKRGGKKAKLDDDNDENKTDSSDKKPKLDESPDQENENKPTLDLSSKK